MGNKTKSRKDSNSSKGLIVLCVLLIIVSLVTVLSLVVIVNEDFRGKIVGMFALETQPQTIGNSGAVTPTRGKSNVKTLVGKTQKASKSYIDDTLFLGDSRTVGMVEVGLLDASQVIAEIGISHSTALTQYFYNEEMGGKYTIAEELSMREPTRVMISYGINGVAFMEEKTFMQDYEAMVDLVQENAPEATIIIQSILPVGEQQENLDESLNNDTIDMYNQKLLELAKDKAVYFLDTSDCLKDSDNYLSSDYDIGDGLHFNADADRVLYDYILTHAVS